MSPEGALTPVVEMAVEKWKIEIEVKKAVLEAPLKIPFKQVMLRDSQPKTEEKDFEFECQRVGGGCGSCMDYG